MNRAVFLDRDGVINEEPPHNAHRLDQLKLISGAIEAVRLLNSNEFIVVVVTNQGGIAHGYFHEKDTKIFNKAIEDFMAKENAYFDAIYYCPHHSDAEIERYRIECECRKPRPGMLIRAQQEFNIDFKQSFIVGDRLTDIEAGKRVGCKTIMVRTGYGAEELNSNHVECDYIANDLHDAVENILHLSHNRKCQILDVI